MKRPKLTVSVGIPAHNEEKNILQLLESIKRQKNEDLSISHIYLISDGSTDNTVQIAKNVDLKQLTIIDHKKSVGKSRRMVELFKLVDEDILILLDADVILNNNDSLRKLIEPIIAGNATLSCGRPIKVNTNSIVDRALNGSIFLQDYVKENIDHGNNIYSCHGRILAVSKKLYKHHELKPLPTGNDAFMYIFNTIHGTGFAYIPAAQVRFKMPQTIGDYNRQRVRYAGTKQNLIAHFGKDIESLYSIPTKVKVNGILKAIIKHPLDLFYYFCLLATSVFAKKDSTVLGWKISSTTKTVE